MTSTLETRQKGTPESAAQDQQRVTLHASTLGDKTPSRILIAPWGEVASTNGTFVVDAESSREVVEAFAAHGTDVPIDYEHQSLGGTFASPTGQAPAAGWISALKVIAPEFAGEGKAGLWAEVTWTDAGKAKLAAREYRYLSPVVIVRKRDRRVVALHSAALTNKPAIVGMTPIVNRQDEPDDTEASETPETSETTSEDAYEMLRMRLGLEAGVDEATLLVSAEQRLHELLQHQAQHEAEQRVERASRAGKLTPHQHEWAMELALRDPETFDRWLETTPIVIAPGRLAAPHSRDRSGRRTAIVASAKARYRTEPVLAQLTSEEAWVQESLRESGVDVVV